MSYETKLVDLVNRIQANTTSHQILTDRLTPYLDTLQAGRDRLDKPTMATWNLTRSCNLKCAYCAVNAHFGKPTQETLTSQHVLNKVLSLNLKYISLLGGEPTLCPELPTYINSLVKAGVFVDMTTNGAKITKELINSLCYASEQKLLSLMISLDSADATINDSVRGPGSFKVAVRASKTLRKNNIPFSIGMTISKANLHQVLNTYELAKEIGASLFCSWFVMPAGRANRSIIAQPDEEYIKQTNAILDSVENGGLPIGRMDLSYATVKLLKKNPAMSIGFDRTSAEVISILNCEGCKYRILIDYNGDVYPCDFLQYPSFRLGNILTDNWQSIWDSPPARYKSQLKRSTKPGCKDCPALGCDTGCFGITFANFLATGNILPMCEV